jgi:hypothetical protein
MFKGRRRRPASPVAPAVVPRAKDAAPLALGLAIAQAAANPDPDPDP